jgi:hypothetical protein
VRAIRATILAASGLLKQLLQTRPYNVWGLGGSGC